MTEAAPKDKPDWEKAKALYRSNAGSVREIARQCSMSHTALQKRIAREEWQHDLADRVQRAVKEKLLREDAAVANPTAQVATGNLTPAVATDDQIIESAVAGPVQVIKRHRFDGSRAAKVCGILFEQLEEAVLSRPELEEEAEQLAREGGPIGYAQRRAALLKALSLPSHAGTAKDLVTALRGLQEMERIAWGIQKEIAPASDYETELKRLAQGA